MVEKKLSIHAQDDIESWEIPQDVVYEIMKYIPTTINDDSQERKEEVLLSQIHFGNPSALCLIHLSLVRILYPRIKTLR